VFAGHGGFVMHRLVTGMVFGFALLLAPTAGFAQIQHYEASNCELYVEKFQLKPGSYNSINANIYLKVAAAHLDGAIKEVGFRARTYSSPVDLTEEQVGWRNMVAAPVDPFSKDLWKVSVLLEAGPRVSRHEGAFYVLTDADTMFWLHPMNDDSENFSIDTNTFAIAEELVWNELWVNDFERFLGFNPDGCI